MKSLRGNIVMFVVLRFIAVLLAFQVTRLGFYLFNTDLFPTVGFGKLLYFLFAGLKFDVSAALYLNALFIVAALLPFQFRFNKGYKKLLNVLYIVPNVVGILANVADFIYYRFTLRRTTSSVFGFISGEDNMHKLFFRFLFDYWPATLFAIVFITLFVWSILKIRVGKPLIKNRYLHFGLNLPVLALVAGLSIAGMRGGFSHSTRPITLSNAAAYVDSPEETAIVLNTPFCIIRTIDKEDFERKSYFTSAQELDSYFDPVYRGSENPTASKNVVIVILESFSREYVGFLNKDLDGGRYKGYTPFLDSLMQHSLVFENAFANGNKSIDAIPAVVAGIPAMEMPYILSHHSSNTINSLAGTLSKTGYQSLFFHGAPNGSMGFDAFCRLAGFDRYYGKNEFGNNNYNDGIWGIWDEPFLNYTTSVLNQTNQPFFATIFTLSSHHPFKVPAHYEGQFNKGSLPIHQCIMYTDNALRKFFNSARQQPWFNNTLFVFTADHSFEKYFDEYKNSLGFYSIPLFFYSPDSADNLTGLVEYEIQQTDIPTTVLNYLGYKGNFLSWGNDALNVNGDHFVVNHYNSHYQFISNGYVIQFDGEKTTAMFNYRTDRFMQHNILTTETERASRMELKLKAFIQQFNNRVLENQMVVE
jgi:phosphoglycerol transferase MdoB-like AlkP superfamily enzyme